MLAFAFASETAHETLHHVAEHASSHGETEQQAVKELANFATLLIEQFHGTVFGNFVHRWENVIFSAIAACILVVTFLIGTRKKEMIPAGFQNFLEMIIESLENMVVGIIGSNGQKYVPFIGTLFLYIFVQNWMGLIPGLKSPTSSINTTAGLAVCVFFYVQFVGLRENGFKHYILHLMGGPKDLVGWLMVPLNLPLHILEEFIRPLSLALRLFGNITGEDALIAVFAGFGIMALNAFHSPIGLPLQLPFMMLSMLLGTIQALVFSLLSTIYISLMLPHDDHSELQESGAAHAHH